MTFKNSEISKEFDRVADALEAQNDNPFRVRAYRRASRNINRLNHELSDLIAAKEDLTKISGIGKVIAQEIEEIFSSNSLDTIDKIIKRKKSLVVQKLLQTKVKSRKINKPQRTRKKTIRNYRFFRLYPIIEMFLDFLRKSEYVQMIEPTGEYRRRVPIVHELKILVASKTPRKIREMILQYPNLTKIYEMGNSVLKLQLASSIDIELNMVSIKAYGKSLLSLTGSVSHNKALQRIAMQKGKSLTKNSFLGKTEEGIYNALQLRYIAPELRENRGEIKASKNNLLPELITLKDIRGDLHCHTDATDGHESLESMVENARLKGYEYIAITDHSEHLKIARGLSKKQLLQQIRAIDKLNEKFDNFTILKSTEVDILEDGTLDFPNDVLKELDLTVCSIHSQFRISMKKQTDRILRAMDNPYFSILGHATGRLIRSRDPYEIHIEKILRKCKEVGCFIELNAQPYRLDIQDIYCQMAKTLGVKIAISSDAHSCREMEYMQFGIFEARRGWLSAQDVLNTRNLITLRKLLKR